MKTKKRVAFFPIFADTVSVVRYFSRYRTDLSITELISLPGSGVCGKDASFVDNRETFGMVVKTTDQVDANSWDELYLLDHDTNGVLGSSEKNALYDPVISIANANSKSIRCISNNNGIESDFPGENKNTYKRYGILHPIDKFVVFVGGVIGEANSFEVFLYLYGELGKKLNVTAFSSAKNADICDVVSLSRILNEKQYCESDKVFAINNAIRDTVKKSNADLVLIHVEEPMMSFSNALTNGFGIVPYMISQIITPDYSICCLPCDCASPGFINDFSEGIDGRFCFSPDVWHISNAFLDHAIASEIQDSSAIYAPMGSIEPVLKQYKNNELKIGSLIDSEFLTECTNTIISEWKTSRLVEIIK